MVEVGKDYACLESDIIRIWHIIKVDENPRYDMKDPYSSEHFIEGYLTCLYIDGEIKINDKRKYDIYSANDLEEMANDDSNIKLLEDVDTKKEIFEMIFWSWE